jgi:polyphosphate kinase
VAPLALRRRLTELIAGQARPGGRIVLKMNSLVDGDMIAALYAASTAGADIDLIVRGACMLPPGIAGVTDRIRVRSIVGRFLEHSRIAYFRWGAGANDEALYLSSADWMGRNMYGRIEVGWPVREARMRQRIIDECLVPYLLDCEDAWTLAADGSYSRVAGAGPSAQQALMQRYAGREGLSILNRL